MLVIAIGLGVAQQLSGIAIMMYYLPIILDHAGVANRRDNFLIMFFLGIVKTASVVLSMSLLDRPGSTGRRSMLLCSFPGCAFSLFLLALGYGVGNTSIAISAVVSFVFFYSVGAGPVCWLIPSEIFPIRMRTKGVSLTTGINRVVNSVTAITFLEMVEVLGDDGVFYCYAGFCLCSTLFIATFVPETKGKALEEMAEYFEAVMGLKPEFEKVESLLPPPDQKQHASEINNT